MSPTNPIPPALPPGAAPAPQRRTLNACLIAALIGVVLLIGIFVIAIVAAVAVPAFSAAKNKGQPQKTRSLTLSIVNACKGYYAEYSKYPLPLDGATGEVNPLRTGELLTGTLLGYNLEQNPKGMNFLPDLERAKRGRGSGLLSEGGTASIVDPWGEPFYVLMDADYSGDIANPNAGSVTARVLQGVLVFSAGRDKDPSTWEDNIMSWESVGRSPGARFAPTSAAGPPPAPPPSPAPAR